MTIKTGNKIVAHTRLAVDVDSKITLFVPGEIIVVGTPVSAVQAQEWIDRGSAAIPTADDVKAWDAMLAEVVAAEKADAAKAAAAEAAAAAPAAADPAA